MNDFEIYVVVYSVFFLGLAWGLISILNEVD